MYCHKQIRICTKYLTTKPATLNYINSEPSRDTRDHYYILLSNLVTLQNRAQQS